MEIMSATPEQIVEFKKAAAARYIEKGIKPEVADQLFADQMAKIAAEMQIAAPAPTAPIEVAPSRQEKVASFVAAQLGRSRTRK